MIRDEAEELYAAVQQRNHTTMERLIGKRVWSLRAYHLALLVNLRDVAARIRYNHPGLVTARVFAEKPAPGTPHRRLPLTFAQRRGE